MYNFAETLISTMKKIIETRSAPAPIGPYSQAVTVNGITFVSGQVALDPSNGEMKNSSLEEETETVMANLKAVLTEAGLGLEHVVKSSIFLKDMNDFSVVNKIYGEQFKGAFPARETVEVSRLPKDARVEISVIAVKA
jgi:2-iminobutanoate/2-iminopropanoate deaminase